MKYKLIYSPAAVLDLKNLPIKVSQRIFKKVDFFISQTNPLKFAKVLQGEFKGLYRFRVGDYRVIFRKSATGEITILIVLAVGHRKEVYE